MTQYPHHRFWLASGKYRKPILVTLRKPMTNGEIWSEVSREYPKVYRRAITRALKELMAMGYIYQLNPEASTGRLYWFTNYGRTIASKILQTKIRLLPGNIDWHLYSFVIASQTRTRVLLFFSKLLFEELKGPLTATQTRTFMREKHPLSFTQIHRALHELLSVKLLRSVGFTEKKNMRLYAMTDAGQRVVAMLKR